MSSLWQSKTGKLFIGGCGTQLGLLMTFGGLIVMVLVCAVCASSSALTIGMSQPRAAQMPATGSVETPTPAAELVQLRQEVDLLLDRVQYLRDNVPTVAPPTPSPTPVPPTPMVTAGQAAVNLRSGPGVNYSRIGRLPLGESLPIVGRNASSSWWLVATPGGGVAWVSALAVGATFVDDTIPVVSIPALLVQPAAQSVQPGADLGQSFQPPATAPEASYPAVLPETGPNMPRGTPTAVAGQSRRFVQDTLGYKQLIRRMLLPTVSESFSPHGDLIAITERISLYTITPDGTTQRILLEDDETIDLVGGAVWSPDGQYLAFAANHLRRDCDPCRTVGLVRMSDGEISYLEPPPSAGLDLPRWTQDGRLLVVAYSDELSEGNVYSYDISGRQGERASGSYVLSSSHDGQKWFPWLPGRSWDLSRAEGISSYYSD